MSPARHPAVGCRSRRGGAEERGRGGCRCSSTRAAWSDTLSVYGLASGHGSTDGGQDRQRTSDGWRPRRGGRRWVLPSPHVVATAPDASISVEAGDPSATPADVLARAADTSAAVQSGRIRVRSTYTTSTRRATRAPPPCPPTASSPTWSQLEMIVEMGNHAAGPRRVDALGPRWRRRDAAAGLGGGAHRAGGLDDVLEARRRSARVRDRPVVRDRRHRSGPRHLGVRAPCRAWAASPPATWTRSGCRRRRGRRRAHRHRWRRGDQVRGHDRSAARTRRGRSRPARRPRGRPRPVGRPAIGTPSPPTSTTTACCVGSRCTLSAGKGVFAFSTTTVVDYYDLGADVQIVAPPADQVRPLSELTHFGG